MIILKNKKVNLLQAKAIEAVSIICIMKKALPYTAESKLLTVAESAVGVKW